MAISVLLRMVWLPFPQSTNSFPDDPAPGDRGHRVRPLVEFPKRVPEHLRGKRSCAASLCRSKWSRIRTYLQRYKGFFNYLRRGFPEPVAASHVTFSRDTVSAPRLQVHDVGDFEASFVPRIPDFDRLDERFRIASDVWDQLSIYQDYGFAVFKLKGRKSHSLPSPLRLAFRRDHNTRRVHPMAFTFPRRHPELLYFPTVHVHDRTVHPRAMFDHMLYCQPTPDMERHVDAWERSMDRASEFMDVPRSKGIIDSDGPRRES